MKMTLWSLGAFRALLLTTLCMGVLMIAGCGKDYSRMQFRELVLNKTEGQVREVIGAPNLVKSNTWYYFNKTYDRVSKQVDYRTSLTFRPDPATGQTVVKSVDFSSS